MSKKLSQNVPKLRFPAFKGDWEYLKIEGIASVTSGGTPNRSEPSFWNGNIPWVTTSELGQAEIHDSIEKITEKGLQNSSAKIFKKDTILLAMYGQGKTRGQVSILKIQAATNQACAAIALQSGFNSQFIYYFLFKEYDNLRGLANDGSQKNLTAGLIKQYKVPVTHINEQEKIASFLGTVDRRITQLRRKRELLQTYKRGVMQKIFSQEIRFKGAIGSPFPDWEKKKLGDLATDGFSNGVFNDPNKVGKGYRLINVKDMYEGDSINVKSLSQLSIDEKEFRNNQAKYGDIFFTRSSLVKEGIAHSNVLLATEQDITYDGHLIRFRFDIQENQPQFVSFALKSSMARKQLVSRGKTGTMTTIGQEDISTVEIGIPVKEEQEKIASFLSAIDQKIEVISRQISHTEQFKKGLLQKMFV